VHHPRVAAARVQAQLEEAGVEARGAAGEADVAHQREVDTRAHGGTVHRGDRRPSRPGDAQKPVVDRVQARSVGLAEAAQVGARAERRRRASDNDRADGLVGLEGVERRHDLVDHRAGQGVAAVRIVQRDDGDPAVYFHTNQGHSAARTTAGEWRKKASTSFS